MYQQVPIWQLFFIMLILYFGQLLVVVSIYDLYSQITTAITYFIPLFIVLTVLPFLYLAEYVSDIISMLIFTAVGTYLGFIHFMLYASMFYQIINHFISISFLPGFILLIILPLTLGIYSIYNVKNIQIEKLTLKSNKIQSKFTIAHLSDMHLGGLQQKAFVQKVVNMVSEINPDLVVITGDMADGSVSIKNEWLSPFDQLTMPIYFINGNHECLHGKEDVINLLKNTNIKYVSEFETYKGINFIGLDFNEKNKEKEQLRKLKELYTKNNLLNVLMSHVPRFRPEHLSEYDIFLQLAGHTHGGQLFPLHVFSYNVNACFAGLYSDIEEKHHVYVSQGIGAAAVPMKFGAKSVLGVITLEPDNEHFENNEGIEIGE